MSHAASITLVGRAGTDPQLSSGPTGDRVSLRVVATERRFDKDGVTQYFTEIKADAIGLDVAKVGGRIARRSTDSWTTGGAAAESREEAATDQEAANRGAPEAAPADSDETLPPERYADEDPWGLRDTASVERGGELVGSG